MPSLQQVLASIPFVGGYEAAREQEQTQSLDRLRRMGALSTLQAQLEARQREAGLRQALAGLPADASMEHVTRAVLPYAGADTTLRTIQSSRDREAMREQRLYEIELRGQEAIARVREAERERRITKEEADRREAAMRENMMRLAASLRAPAQPSAPSITEIVDPKDPTKMIRIDARRFDPQRYAAGDAIGVFGVSGREPTAAKREAEKEAGRRQLSSAIDQVATNYDQLEKMGAVITSEQPAAKNIYERAAASGVGQTIAGALGTKAQAVRDQINNAKPLIIAALKQATGMSAQQLNSNAELQFYLQAASDPTKSIEANRAALAILDQTYGLGQGIKANKGAMDALRGQAPKTETQGKVSDVPAGVDPKLWAVMTPEEKALWRK